MAFNASPVMWKCFISAIVGSLKNGKHFLATMNELHTHSSKQSLISHLDEFVRALLKKGFNVCPKKCQQFRTEVH